MIVIPIASERWDVISTAAVIENLASGKPGTPAVMSGKGELPQTYLFQPREGAKGVLQITGFTESPRGVKIRYRLASTAAGLRSQTPPATRSNE